MTTAHICIMLAIIVYLGAMLFVGYLCSKKNNDTSDFYLGGRKLGPLVTAMSAEASDMSSWLLMGLPGLAYLSGIADAGWTAIGLAIGTYLNWKIVAKKIRLYTHVAGNSITLPSFFSNRFRDDADSAVDRSYFYSDLLYSIHSLWFCCMRKAFCKFIRSKLSYCHDHQRSDHCSIYYSRRISCSIHYRLYPEHYHVHCSDHCFLFRYLCGRWS